MSKSKMNLNKNLLVAALAMGGITFGGIVMAEEAPVTTSKVQVEQSEMNWFGGPVYSGTPELGITAALVEAGGGADNFSFATALVSMLGEETVNAEVAKLTEQYGEKNVNDFINGMTFAVKNGLKHATEAGVKLPEASAELKGTELAKALVTAGTAPDHVWWSGYVFDRLLTHDIHVKVMVDTDIKYSHEADRNTHNILNQAMYDVAQALKMNVVKKAPVMLH